MKSFLPVYNFAKGLQTRKAEDFSEPDEFREFLNARVKGTCRRRPGQDRIAVAGTNAAAMNFNGTTQHIEVPYDTRVWTLGLRFSLRVVFKQDDNPTGDEFLIGWSGGTGPIKLKLDSTRKVVFSFTDSASTTTTVTGATALTAGTAYTVLVTRDKDAIKLYVNNVVDATGTVSATLLGKAPTAALYFARDASTYFDGDIDHVLLLNSALADNSEGFLRITDPRADDVLAFYPMENAGNSLVTDYSRYENTGEQKNTPASATTLCIQDSPIIGMAPLCDASGKKKMLVLAGNQYYGVEVV